MILISHSGGIHRGPPVAQACSPAGAGLRPGELWCRPPVAIWRPPI